MKVPEGTSIFGTEPVTEEEGTSTGEYPFIVHGLTGKRYEKKSWDEQIGEAIKHWNNG